MEKSKARKSPFRECTHVAVVVRDLDKALKYLSSLGLGPFEPPHPARPSAEKLFRGKLVKYSVKVAKAKIGQVTLELTQPVEGIGPQKEFLDSKGEGIYHIGFAVDDIDREVAELTEKGVKVLMRGKWVDGGGYAYFQLDAIGGMVLELTQNWR